MHRDPRLGTVPHIRSPRRRTAPTWFAIQAIRNNYLTAVGEGGKYENAFHSDATRIGTWEHLRIVKCGDLGTGYEYTILPADDRALTATDGGGLSGDDGPITRGPASGDPDRSFSRFQIPPAEPTAATRSRPPTA